MFRAHALLLSFTVLFLLGFSSCRPTRLVPKNKSLVVGTGINIDNPAVHKDEMYSYLRIKPNRRMFDIRLDAGGKDRYVSRGIPVYLFLYNTVDKNKVDQRRREKQRRRILRAEDPSTVKDPKMVGDFFVRIFHKIGEEPVILDTEAVHKSSRQLALYLNNKGYFNSTVKDSIVYLKNGRKSIIYYNVKTTEPYRLRNINWQVDDTALAATPLMQDQIKQTKLHTGDIYDVDVFVEERDRITKALHDNGYYLFSKDYIHYRVDSAFVNHQMDLTVQVRKQLTMTGENDTSYVLRNHQKFTLNNIYVVTDYVRTRNAEEVATPDTTRADGTYILYHNWLRYKPSTLTPLIRMRSDSLYRESQFEATYREFVALRNFRQVTVNARIAPLKAGPNKLDAYILLQPVPRQSYFTQLEGTNTGGNLGISGSFTYDNYNLFRGAEILELRLKGGTEAQQPLTNTDQNTGATEQLAFNTIEIGPELSIYFPREFFPFNLLGLKKAEAKKTLLQTSFNYQHRAEYERTVGTFSYGYNFRYKHKGGAASSFGLYPGEINVVKAKLSESFQAVLDANNDLLLQYRFRDHLTVNDIRISYLFTTQDVNKAKNVNFLKVDLESAGWLLRQGFKLTNGVADGSGSYRIAGIPFAEYLRFYFDYRYYRVLGEHEKLVLRVAQGAGFPQRNFRQLPIEKSFYGGGANGIRAWNARTLGPGGYDAPQNDKYLQFGDIQSEYNIELRFRMFSKSVEGAIFGDAGNIWLGTPDTTRPLGDFDKTRYFKELAFGAGVGLRIDLQFFLLRLDVATPLRDPARPDGDRWHLYQGREFWERTNLNFGIGYPF